MPRYIDADALLRNTIYNARHVPYIAKSDVEDAPTADVVEVVRCKECKYHTEENLGMIYCPHIVGGWESMFHFCSHGERRTDDAEIH